jgi:hypothetical protein
VAPEHDVAYTPTGEVDVADVAHVAGVVSDAAESLFTKPV